MSLAAGSRLGPYEILGPLGKGGMGEVYKATDTRLDRIVAVKVLPEDFTASPERKTRFEREAKAISQLNHPHICTLYDVGEQNGVDFIVLEHIEGETLAQRLDKGALKLDEALRYSIQITDGLETAHRAGIVHRDLKPGNVMLTKSGVKLLDFGLAKVLDDQTDPIASSAPTQQKDLTDERAIVGTLPYMSPEQLEGGEVDARTDIWAFGCVLYEMVTGAKAFEGTSQASLIGAIMSGVAPSVSAREIASPPALDRILTTCITKGPDRRWQSAGDVGRQLQWLNEPGSERDSAASERPRSRSRDFARRVGMVLAAVIAGWLIWKVAMQGAPAPRSVRRSIIPVPESVELTGYLSLSPDGATLVFSGRPRGTGFEGNQLYRRALDQLDAEPIAGTSGGSHMVAISPDGRSLAFYSGDALKTVPMSGGTAAVLFDGDVRGFAWESGDAILLGTRDSGLHRVFLSGDTTETITTAEPGLSHRWPHLLPGGRAVLYTIGESDFFIGQVAAMSLSSGAQRTLFAGGVAQYVSTGHLVFARDEALWAVPFDAERLEVRGTPERVVDAAYPSFVLAADGSLVYAPADINAERWRTLVWVDRLGTKEALLAEPRGYNAFRLSPDGNRLAVSVGPGLSADIWIYDLARTTLTRLTLDPRNDMNPIWTPDGTGVVFGSLRQGGGLFVKAADGTGDAERLSEHPRGVDAATPMAWSRDGTRLLVTHERRARSDVVDVLALAEGTIEPLLHDEFSQSGVDVSPNGRFIAYQSTESGQPEIYVRPFPDVDAGRWPVSTGGGQLPRWAPNGEELFYLGPRSMMAVPIESESPFSAGTPQALFDLAPFDVTCTLCQIDATSYDVSPDGDRLLMLEPAQTQQSNHLILIENWTDELERLVPPE